MKQRIKPKIKVTNSHKNYLQQVLCNVNIKRYGHLLKRGLESNGQKIYH